MTYTFISFGSPITGKNLGVCVIQCEPEEAPEKARELGLEPKEPVEVQAYKLNEEEFKDQGLELDRLYSRKEMIAMEFEKG